MSYFENNNCLFRKGPLQSIDYGENKKRCDLCASKTEDNLMKPYSLEYLAMQVVMNKYVKNEMLSGKGNYFIDMNLPRKWNSWIFSFYQARKVVKKRIRDHGTYFFGLGNPRPTLLEHHLLVLMISKLLENPQYYIENKTIDAKRELQKFCEHCHSAKCIKCGWLKRIPKSRLNLRFSGHLSKCIEKF